MARVRKDKSSFIWSWRHVYRFFSICCNFLQGNSRNSLYMKIRDVSCMILPQNYNCTTKTPLLSKYANYDVKHFPMLGAPSFLVCPFNFDQTKKIIGISRVFQVEQRSSSRKWRISRGTARGGKSCFWDVKVDGVRIFFLKGGS